MKNIFNKIIKIIPFVVVTILVFSLCFIFINNKLISNREFKDFGTLSFQNKILDTKTNNDNNTVTPISYNKEVEKEINIPSSKDNFNILNTVTDPYYYGVGNKGLTPTQISLLTKDFKKNTTPLTVAVSPVDQVWYFAYKDSYPPLESIKDQNGFELISDFTVTTGNKIMNSSGISTTYRIYEYNNVTTLTSYKVTYIE